MNEWHSGDIQQWVKSSSLTLVWIKTLRMSLFHCNKLQIVFSCEGELTWTDHSARRKGHLAKPKVVRRLGSAVTEKQTTCPALLQSYFISIQIAICFGVILHESRNCSYAWSYATEVTAHSHAAVWECMLARAMGGRGSNAQARPGRSPGSSAHLV